MKVLILDPSVNNVGWAQLDTSQLPTRHALKGRYGASEAVVAQKQFAINAKKSAWTWGTFQLEGGSKNMRFMDLVQQIITTLGAEFDYLITEMPAFYSSERGQIAARQNYTIDLAACAFFVAGWLHMDHRKHHSITAITWKGSVSKQVTAKAFFRVFGSQAKGTTEHSIDAVMLGHYWLKNWFMESRELEKHISRELLAALL